MKGWKYAGNSACNPQHGALSKGTDSPLQGHMRGLCCHLRRPRLSASDGRVATKGQLRPLLSSPQRHQMAQPRPLLLTLYVSGQTNLKADTNLENMACLANSTSSGDTATIWPVSVNRAQRGSSGSTIFFLHLKDIFQILK